MGRAVHSAEALPRPQRRGLSRVQAADFFGVSPSTFDKMVRDGIAPKPFAIYNRWVYDFLECDRAFNKLKGGAPEQALDDWGDFQ